jgi:hypothetical protein
LLFVERNFSLQDSQTRCIDLENERQRIQTEFEDYYQRTHHLEELQQQKSLNNSSEPIVQVLKFSSKLKSQKYDLEWIE